MKAGCQAQGYAPAVRRILALLLVAAFAVALVACSSSSEDDASSGPADDGPEGAQIVRATGRDHVEGAVDYPSSPPAGGDHNEVWHNCGFFTEPVPNELAVHSICLLYTSPSPRD